MICPTVGAEPFAAPIVASPVLAKHGYCRSWLTSGLYKSVHVLFFGCAEDRLSANAEAMPSWDENESAGAVPLALTAAPLDG